MGLEEPLRVAFAHPGGSLGDTASPAAELVAAGFSAEVGGGEEAVAAPTGRGAQSARCAAAGSGCSSAGPDKEAGREGGGKGQAQGQRDPRRELQFQGKMSW